MTPAFVFLLLSIFVSLSVNIGLHTKKWSNYDTDDRAIVMVVIIANIAALSFTIGMLIHFLITWYPVEQLGR